MNHLYLCFILLLTSILSVYSEYDQRLLFNSLYSDVLDKPEYADSSIVYEVDFSKAASEAENPSDWFNGKGFQSQFADKIKLQFESGGISFAARRSSIAVWGLEKDIPSATKVRIRWGVNIYPNGANYEIGRNYSAISLNIAFGKEKFSSGFPFIPSAPYFISLFPGEKESAGKIFKHKYWKKTSRHICVSSGAPEHQLITTDFDLKGSFEQLWLKEMPTISGFLIAINTNNKSKAYIQKITFLK